MARTKGSKTTNPNAKKTGPKPKPKLNASNGMLKQRTLSFKTKDADHEEAQVLDPQQEAAPEEVEVLALPLQAAPSLQEVEGLDEF
jgi:hypothetical protein